MVRSPRLARVALSCVVVIASATACSSAVEVAPAPLGTSQACSQLPWPATVGNQERVATSLDDPSVAAWGDPAIIARCGLPALAPTTDQCVEVDGVGWVVRELSDGTAAVLYGHDPAIEVLAPATYGPVPLLLPALTASAKALPGNGRSCT